MSEVKGNKSEGKRGSILGRESVGVHCGEDLKKKCEGNGELWGGVPIMATLQEGSSQRK